jgi:2-(1,2-epoxy-1,2-dihydrophenyl)acetyl-CoA isomerase
VDIPIFVRTKLFLINTTSFMSDTIDFTLIGNVAKIALNRPKVYNSFNREMALALQARLEECKNNPEIRAVYLTGNGKAFCAGQDLGEVVGENAPDLTKILNEHLNPIVRLIRNLDKPVICAVNGVAAGAGANMALACDITFAAERVSFIQAFSKIGLIPDMSGTYNLPRLIGMQRATALMMTGDKLSASEAEKIGMIYKAVPNEELENVAFALAEKLSKMPTAALGMTKRALNASLSNSLEEQLKVEDKYQTAASQTEDYAEGVAAFLEKRKPVFKGK